MLGKRVNLVFPTLAVTASSAYAAGNSVGGVLVIPNAFQVRGVGLLQSVMVSDLDNQKAPLDILLFNAQPTGPYTDKTAVTISAGDFALTVGKVSVLAADYTTFGTRAFANIAKLFLSLKNQLGTNNTNLWALMVLTSGTPTWTTTTSLKVGFGIAQD